MTILLTGATGTLGSQILFSLLEQKFDDIEQLFLPVREKKSSTPEERVLKMLQSVYAPDFVQRNLDQVRSKIKVLPASVLLHPQPVLNDVKITYFIHSAGYVNLSTAQDAKEEIFRENLEFTQQIFEGYAPLIEKFVYISTAFSAGNTGGILSNDYANTQPLAHRNHYEAAKYATERFLIQAGERYDLPIQILRPSVLGGNMMDSPNFFISKYMVFYLFAKFFYKNTSKDRIRITAHSESGLNIVPTDYAAKVITSVFDTDIKQLNIVHPKTTHIIRGICNILETVAFNNFSLTHHQIDETTGFESKLEQFYYRTIGVHLTPYLTSKPCEWDTTLLQQILPIPNYNLEEYLINTIQFAKYYNFRNQQW